MSQIPAICDRVEATPEGDLPEADGGDLRNATQHRNYCFNVLGTVEFIDIDLPEVVAGSALGIGAALLVLFTGPEPIWMAFIFRGHDDHLVLWIFLLLEAPENFQRAIPRVALRRRNVARARRGAFSPHNLVGVRPDMRRVGQECVSQLQ